MIKKTTEGASKCPKCSSDERYKSVFHRGFQRYKCKNCGCHYTKERRGYDVEKRRQALVLYLEGVGLRGIERIIGVSHVTIGRWISSSACKIIELVKQREIDYPRDIQAMEIDEMWHFIGSKKTESGCGWLLTEIPGKFSPSCLVSATKKR